MADKLTTTSYAILGHLAMRPWTMYDLAAQMRRNVHYFYPRAESQVYAEPKRLVALGLAASKTEAVGRRNRTIYSITPTGRRALSQWLRRPLSKGPLLEFEGLLRVFLAPFGSDADLSATLEQVREEIGRLLQLSATIREEYTAGRAPFQQYAPTRAMIHDFLTHFALLVDAWSERSLESARQWQDASAEDRQATAIATFRRNAITARPARSRAATTERQRAARAPQR